MLLFRRNSLSRKSSNKIKNSEHISIMTRSPPPSPTSYAFLRDNFFPTFVVLSAIGDDSLLYGVGRNQGYALVGYAQYENGMGLMSLIFLCYVCIVETTWCVLMLSCLMLFVILIGVFYNNMRCTLCWLTSYLLIYFSYVYKLCVGVGQRVEKGTHTWKA